MNLLSTLVVVVAVGLANLIAAQDCNAQQDEYGQGIVIYTQDQLDQLTQNCTTLYGDLVVGSNYTGSFIVHNLTNITSSLSVQNSTGLTSLEAPDLISLYVAGFSYASSLRSISLPQLQTAEVFTVKSRTPLTVSAPNLRNVSYLNLLGSGISFDLSKLENITTGSSICGESGCDTQSSQIMKIDLPALRQAASLYVGGNVSSLSLPVLASAGNITQATASGYGDYDAGFTVHTTQHLNFSVPELSYMNGSLSLRGVIDTISAPSLVNATADILIEAWTPLAVNLSSLEYADDITVTGEITSTDFSSLKMVNSFSLSSSKHLNCDKVIPSNTSVIHEHCDAAPAKKSTLARNIGIGVGVGVGASLLLAVAGIAIYRRRHALAKKKRKGKQAVGAGVGAGTSTGEDNSTLELRPVSSGERREAESQSRGSMERGADDSEGRQSQTAVAPAAVVVPSEPPPPYSRWG
ncbi:uncharacterized protein BO66DRAFT_472660 [Aspergillus aculeatinus CBS 121060]|uniref:Uncharacterized protein n=1 Tax=Aspergillus aculeatinus CBS 121060 TaxID=1448322 RepID=A0ACD1H4W1_9EURO|nr:hypothetical protein BO66DRAFT_472660 [Aspergillus aculeatinus CBS 121060]RAH68451.1 hypothetical protein BO66DRAFT_472660 [Aspergillus aculeatinus CBS 121060]